MIDVEVVRGRNHGALLARTDAGAEFLRRVLRLNAPAGCAVPATYTEAEMAVTTGRAEGLAVAETEAPPECVVGRDGRVVT